MEENVVPLLLGQVGGQVDPRPEHPQHEGGGDAVGQPDVFLSRQRYGSDEPPPERQQGDQAVGCQGGGSGQPYCGGDESRSGGGLFLRDGEVIGDGFLCVPDGGGRRLNGVIGEVLVPLGVQRRNPGLNPEPGQARSGGVGRYGGEQAEPALDGERAQQAEQHHRPQHIGKHPWRFPQGQPDQQDKQNDNRRRPAHAQHGLKQLFHELTPCSRL